MNRRRILRAGLIGAGMAVVAYVVDNYPQRGWQVEIEQVAQGFGGPAKGPELPPPQRRIFTGRVGDSFLNTFRISRILDEKHVRIAFYNSLLPVAPGAWRWKTDQSALVRRAIASETETAFVTNTVCGGVRYTYRLVRVTKTR